jgi:predicted acyltransferase
MTQRFRSLDIFRGATVALMILVNNPGSWGHLFSPLAHAGWHGCTPTDLVFPFFLFAVGNALAFVMPGLQDAAAATFWPRVLKRVAIIFAIGLFLNASPFVRWDGDGALVLKSFESLRFMGVLQRIALCFGAAAALVWALPAVGQLWRRRRPLQPARLVWHRRGQSPVGRLTSVQR